MILHDDANNTICCSFFDSQDFGDLYMSAGSGEMKLDHVSVTLDDKQGGPFYRIRAELKGIPGKQWQEGLKFVWHNSSYYLRKKSELIMKDNEIELLIEESGDLQHAIDALSNAVSKADKIVRSYGVTNISNYKKAIN